MIQDITWGEGKRHEVGQTNTEEWGNDRVQDYTPINSDRRILLVATKARVVVLSAERKNRWEHRR